MKEPNKKEGVTIYDIAKKLKISTSTVSRALNNNSRISEKTRNKVLSTAKEMGYKPNVPQAYVVPKREKKIGVIVPMLDKGIYSDSINGIRDIAAKNNYDVIISLSDNNAETQAEILDSFASLNLEGIIISFARETTDLSPFINLQEKGINIVCYNRVNYDMPMSKVIMDNFYGAYSGTEHLISVGCKTIAHLSGNIDCPIYSERVKGYKAALKNAGIRFNKDYLMYSELTHDDLSSFIEYLFSLPTPPDGLLINDNLLALQAHIILSKSGIAVPQDVAIVSFGSEPFNAYITPAFTSIEYSSYDMGVKTAELLFHEIDKGQSQDKRTIIESTKLIIRNSTIRNY